MGSNIGDIRIDMETVLLYKLRNKKLLMGMNQIIPFYIELKERKYLL